MLTTLWWLIWRNLAESAFGGSMKSDGWFYVGTFDRNQASVIVNMFFTYNLHYKDIL